MVLHLRGIFLPDETQRDAWIVEGRLSFTPPARSSDVDTIVSSGWVIPGFVDAHCHIGIASTGHVRDPRAQARQALLDRDAGALLLREAGSPVDTSSVRQRDDLPRLIRAGRHIARTRRYIRDQGVEVDPDALADEVERQAATGDGWVKIVGDWIDRASGDLAPTFPEDALERAVARAHALNVRVAVHAFGEDAVAAAIAVGVDSIEHGTGLTGQMLGDAVSKGIALVPTLINVDNFHKFAAAGEHKFPIYARHMRALYASSRERVRDAYEAGVPIYTGTDAGTDVPHGTIRGEIQALVGAGLPLPEVIAQASWRARQWLGWPGLDEGAPADLVVFDEDPRVALDTIYSPRRTVLRGVVVG
ncbi:amidohydrolase family protein [Sphaerisporangium sp. NPDC051017]|uniref:amidohydrolase family protein n=1 Tax=Sphaerisporangium sp. NPDC051017 TaxID=3154636 RepID=UPI0034223563